MYTGQCSAISVTKVLVLAFALAPVILHAQSPTPTATPVPSPNAAQTQREEGKGLELYREILSPSLSAQDVHGIRELSIQREDIHISFTDGTIGLMRAVDGHITGAVFEGVGEILLIAPDRAERTSLALFTGSAVLERRFTSAYLRFVDDKLADEFRSGFRPAPEEGTQEFIARWDEPMKTLARGDGLAILQSLTNTAEASSKFLHLRMAGSDLGMFDVYWNTNAPEQIGVFQGKATDKEFYYDTWASFPMQSVRNKNDAVSPRFELDDYQIRAGVEPPSFMNVAAQVTLRPRRAGQRTFVMELSRYLQISEVQADGHPVEFIQNQAISGSDLARRGDDLVGIVFPQALPKDQAVRLTFKYAGPVMFNAGSDLLYVGARGTWYPNSGPMFANFDLTFEFPEDWALVATGKQVVSKMEGYRHVSRFVTEKPITRAGFNLGKFVTAETKSNGVTIHAYAAKNVEEALAAHEARAGKHPEPSREVQQIATRAADTVRFLSSQLDPFPYSNLEITQIPGLESQSWPGLIYLSSMAFLDADERRAAGVKDPYTEFLLDRLMLAHETGHQWWGDAVDWVSYRDEWIIEALANYSALLMLEKEDPRSTRIALDYYKGQLLQQTSHGIIGDAGPVTLGPRLTSSKFPGAYQRVLYGRGTWLIHMLREMLREANGGEDDTAFFAALKSLLAQSPNHKISTRELQAAFEKVLPASLTYEGKKSLDWFFDSWVNGASIPQFNLDDVKLTAVGAKVRVTGTIRQSHTGKDTVTAVPVFAVNRQGISRFLAFVFVDDPETAFKLAAPAGTTKILLDPQEMILRR
jgi:hypothetical protein